MAKEELLWSEAWRNNERQDIVKMCAEQQFRALTNSEKEHILRCEEILDVRRKAREYIERGRHR